MEIGPFWSVTSSTHDQIVDSVGPYIFQSEPVRDWMPRASSCGSDSAPQSALSPGLPRQPDASSICQVAGVACSTVAPLCSISFANATPSTAHDWFASTTRPPVTSGKKSSSPAMSKEIVVTATSTSFCENPGRSRIEVKKLTTERWQISTPFGLPVDPDV